MVEDKQTISRIISRSAARGWVLEPDAERILSLEGIPVPRFKVVTTHEEAISSAHEIGYPVVAKVISPDVLHKSDVHGVEIGIDSDERLIQAFNRFASIRGFTGMLVEEIISGLELILGAQNDYQFGPMILLGIGGTGVEIYQDVTLRMAPLKPGDVALMVSNLRGHKLLEGYRGADPVNMEKLTSVVLAFSGFIMDFKDSIQSVDINPLKCSPEDCIAVDTRIMLSEKVQAT
jgi:acetate---CoA ligase (ADP-forming) subunit beta